jgi:hypothetical protein
MENNTEFPFASANLPPDRPKQRRRDCGGHHREADGAGSEAVDLG